MHDLFRLLFIFYRGKAGPEPARRRERKLRDSIAGYPELKITDRSKTTGTKKEAKKRERDFKFPIFGFPNYSNLPAA
ncbi:hypothetical protein [Methanosarcina acetivorans]|uniref:hypothetical protein n=1 Tax=Methanosarcina acetivorans TaxID=2214 RepID=UPI0012FEA79D|nr:hypothetical protein [Methanosarcina acetivorans]